MHNAQKTLVQENSIKLFAINNLRIIIVMQLMQIIHVLCIIVRFRHDARPPTRRQVPGPCWTFG
jgi:hypothetical protein